MNDTTQDTAAITVPLDLFKRLVRFAESGVLYVINTEQAKADVAAARREIEQVEALLAANSIIT